MEVHAHTHTARKKWTHYLWEFLMLFLAVFCGFLAENQREHYVEHRREKEYMVSLIEDLNTDSVFFSQYSSWRNRNNIAFDSLELIFKRPDYNKFGNDIYRYSVFGTAFGSISVSSRTIKQLENSGGLRLVRNKKVAKNINRHYLYVERLQFHNESQRMFRMKLLESRSALLNGTILSDFYEGHLIPDTNRKVLLISDDPVKINTYLNDIVTAKYFNRQVLDDVDSAQRSTLSLMKLIKKEYHLK